MPKLGEHVLSVEEFRGGDESKTYRERIYALSADEVQKAIRVRQYGLKPADSLRELKSDKSLVPLTGCDLLIRRDGTFFSGKAADKACIVNADGKQNSINFEIQISFDQYRFREQIVDVAARMVVKRFAGFRWRQLERARRFMCMIDFPEEPGGLPNVTHHYIKIHDQGGSFAFSHPDGREMVLIMRNTWSYDMARETFFIGVLEGSIKGNTLVYAWGAPGSDRIGVNPGYLRVQCDLDTLRNAEMQRSLRPGS